MAVIPPTQMKTLGRGEGRLACEAELCPPVCWALAPKLLCWGHWLYFALQLQRRDRGSPKAQVARMQGLLQT